MTDLLALALLAVLLWTNDAPWYCWALTALLYLLVRLLVGLSDMKINF